jgi:hypothetical protein
MEANICTSLCGALFAPRSDNGRRDRRRASPVSGLLLFLQQPAHPITHPPQGLSIPNQYIARTGRLWWSKTPLSIVQAEKANDPVCSACALPADETLFNNFHRCSASHVCATFGINHAAHLSTRGIAAPDEFFFVLNWRRCRDCKMHTQSYSSFIKSLNINIKKGSPWQFFHFFRVVDDFFNVHFFITQLL